jgi:hypothetical protein
VDPKPKGKTPEHKTSRRKCPQKKQIDMFVSKLFFFSLKDTGKE